MMIKSVDQTTRVLAISEDQDQEQVHKPFLLRFITFFLILQYICSIEHDTVDPKASKNIFQKNQ